MFEKCKTLSTTCAGIILVQFFTTDDTFSVSEDNNNNIAKLFRIKNNNCHRNHKVV